MADPKQIDELQAQDAAGGSVVGSATMDATYAAHALTLALKAAALSPTHMATAGAAGNGKFVRFNNVLGAIDWALAGDVGLTFAGIGALATFGFAAGNHPPNSTTEKFSMSSSSTSISWNALYANSGLSMSGSSSLTNGYISKGDTSVNAHQSSVHKFAFATSTPSSAHGTLNTATNTLTTCQSDTTTFVVGGSSSTNASGAQNIMDKFLFSTAAAGASHCALDAGRAYSGGCSSGTTGFLIGGYLAGTGSSSRIARFSYADSTTAALYCGDALTAGSYGQSISSATTGFFSTGAAVTRFSFAASVICAAHATLNYTPDTPATSSGPEHGYVAGGYNVATLNRFDYATGTVVDSIGTMTANHGYCAGHQG